MRAKSKGAKHCHYHFPPEIESPERPAAACREGIQSQGIIAETKHYAGNNQETNRTLINDVIDERTLREIYLPAFEASVKQGNVGAVLANVESF